jgi:hypothetical protein
MGRVKTGIGDDLDATIVGDSAGKDMDRDIVLFQMSLGGFSVSHSEP